MYLPAVTPQAQVAPLGVTQEVLHHSVETQSCGSFNSDAEFSLMEAPLTFATTMNCERVEATTQQLRRRFRSLLVCTAHK